MFLLNALSSYNIFKTLTKTRSERFLSLCWRTAHEPFYWLKCNNKQGEHMHISWQMWQTTTLLFPEISAVYHSRERK